MANHHFEKENDEKKNEECLDPESIRRGLGQSLFAGNIVYHVTLDSTNNLAKELALRGAPEGTIVLAEEQTAGMGRRGRSWLSQGKANLLFSILLKPVFPPDRVFSLTMALSLAAVQGIKQETGLSCMIKWPNDIYVGRKKLAGILTEFAARDRCVDWVVLGLGINVNWCPEEKEEIARLATSIFVETAEKVSRNGLLVRIAKQFENHYQRLISGEAKDLQCQWNEYSLVLGKQVVIASDEKEFEGKAVRIDESGALILEDEKGRLRRIVHGDVSLRFTYTET